MDRKIGMYSAVFTLLAVIGFALSMIIDSKPGVYLSSFFIAWGFVPMICSFASISERNVKAAAYTAIAFAAVYSVLVNVVYFTQLTTIRLTHLNDQASQLLNFESGSLFFNYDLLGYAFMALATIFIGLTIKVNNKSDKWLKGLLLVHGVFAISCVFMPMAGVFNSGSKSGDLAGVIALEFWCAYFIPLCILAYKYFKKLGDCA